MYHSGVSSLKRMNLQLAIKTNVAMPKNHLRRISSDSSLYVRHFSELKSYDDDECSLIANYFFSNPCTPKVSSGEEWLEFNSSINSSSNAPSFPVASSDEEYWSLTSKSFQSKTSEFSKSSKDSVPEEDKAKATVGLALISTFGNATILGSQVLKLNEEAPSDALAKSTTNPGPGLGISANGDASLVPIRHDWPCVFATTIEPTTPPPIDCFSLIVKPDSVTPDCKGHAIINKEESVACFQPLTFCSVHKNAGFLKLEDIEKSEYYTRVDVNLPFSRVTHRFNGCVLEFPPAGEFIFFKKNNEVLDGDDEDFSLDLPELDGPGPKSPPKKPKLAEVDESFPVSVRNNFCLDCGRRLNGRDLYLYREFAYCSDDCRYFNTMEAALQRAIEESYRRAEAEVAENPQESAPSPSSAPPSGNEKGKGILYIG